MSRTHANDGDGGHAHAHAPAGGALALAFGLTLAVAVLEAVGGFVARSDALLVDATHVALDATALGIAFAAALAARRAATPRASYGFARVEILAALGNGIALFAVTAVLVVSAIGRLGAQRVPDGAAMLGFAAAGLAINVASGLALRGGAHDDLNVRAALYHVLGDAVGSALVVAGGAAIVATHAAWIDPAMTFAVAAIVSLGVVRIVREATAVLLESTPAHVTVADVLAEMGAVDGVVGVHDLHVWTIGAREHVLTAHVLVADTSIGVASAISRDLRDRLRARFAIGHVTVQFECDRCNPDERIVCCTMDDDRRTVQ